MSLSEYPAPGLWGKEKRHKVIRGCRKRSGPAFSPASLSIVRVSSSPQWVLMMSRLTGHILLNPLPFILSLGCCSLSVVLNNVEPWPWLATTAMDGFLYTVGFIFPLHYMLLPLNPLDITETDCKSGCLCTRKRSNGYANIYNRLGIWAFDPSQGHLYSR